LEDIKAELAAEAESEPASGTERSVLPVSAGGCCGASSSAAPFPRPASEAWPALAPPAAHAGKAVSKAVSGSTDIRLRSGRTDLDVRKDLA